MRSQTLLSLVTLMTTIFAYEVSHYLTATAVVTDHEDHAYLECWQFPTPFKTYPTVGQSLFLGNASNITYVILPPRSGEGIHKPPAPMYVPNIKYIHL